jgi:hypothetical protein
MASAAVLYAATNSAMTWLHTGAPPSQQDVKDFMNFRTGGHTFTFGKWENERGVLPGHAKELLQLAPYPGEGPISGLTSEIGSKIASFPKNIYEVAHSVVTDKPPGFMKDKDWKKLTPAQRLAKQAEFIPQGYEPYAMQGVVNPPQGTELSPEERIVGIRPAGSRVIDPTDLANFMQKKR